MSNTISLNQMPKFEFPDVTVEQEVGRGAESVVYRAHREQQLLAVKACYLRPGEDAQSALHRVRREANLIGRLRHPGIVSIFDVRQTIGGPTLIMEFAQGKTLAESIKGTPLKEADIVAFAKVMAGALSKLHEYSLVHRDIKPQNILLPSASMPKLVDFGFAKVTEPNAKQSNEVVGTLLYSAPEQTRMLKRPVDGRSDLYGLGAVLYECATGSPPFETKDVNELLQHHAVTIPLDVRNKNPKISPVLAAIIAKLLAKDPDDRYQSADGLLADLERIDELNEFQLTNPSGRVSLGLQDERSDAFHDLPLIGRDQELKQLREAWNNSLQGKLGLVLVEGQPGAGKSRLIRELLDVARQNKANILGGKSNPDDPLPYSPLRKALEDHLQKIKRLPIGERTKAEEEIRSAAGKNISFLRRFSPSLEKLFDEQGGPAIEVQENFFYSVLADFFINLGASQNGAVLFLDDVQWLDQASLKVLQRITEQLKTSSTKDDSQIKRFLIATTARNDPESRAGLESFVTAMGVGMTRLQIEPLKGDGVVRLVQAHLGGGEVDPTFVRQLESKTGGNPFAVGEYLRAVMEAGLIWPSWGRWQVDHKGLEKLQLTGDVVQLIIKRIDTLETHTKQVLSTAALWGGRFSAELLADLCGDLGFVLMALAQAAQARIIDRDETGEYVFVHDRLREALITQLSPEQKTTLHQHIAEVLEKRGGDGLTYTLALARHYTSGHTKKNPAKVYKASLEAGMLLKKEFADEEALNFLNQALAISEQANLPSNAELLQAMGEVCIRLELVEDALKHLRAALQLTSDPLRRADIRTQIALAHAVVFEVAPATEEVFNAFQDVGAPFPKSGLVRFFSAMFYFFAGLFIKWTKIGYGTVKGEKRKKYLAITKIYDAAGLVALGSADVPFFVQMVFRPFFYVNRLGPSHELVSVYTLIGFIVATLQIRKMSEAYFKTAVQCAEQLGERDLLAKTKVWHAVTANFGGQPRESELLHNSYYEKYGSALEPGSYQKGIASHTMNLEVRGYALEGLEWKEREFARVGRSGATYYYRSYSAGLLSMLDRTREAAENLKLCEEYIQQHPSKNSFGELYSQKALYLLEQEEFGASLDDLITKHKDLGFNPALVGFHLKMYYIYLAHIRFAQCILATGDRNSEIKALRSALKDTKSFFEVHLKSHHLILSAGLQWLEGQSDKAWKTLIQAEDLCREADSPWGAYEIALMRARILIERGNDSAAKRELRFAAPLALQHGWIGRARRLSREFGINVTGPSNEVSLSTTWFGPGLPTQTGSSISSQAPRRSVASLAPSVPSMQPSATPTGMGSSTTSAFHLQRQLSALLQVNMASAKTLDPTEQAQAIIDEIIGILGAERAFLFLARDGDDNKTFILKVGRDAEKQDLKELAGYSTTVIDKVITSKQPLVFTGSNDGEISVSESVVAGNLRSIIAAPLMRQDRLIGVLYLDNRLAKGLFTEEDTSILLALANHIAIALEVAQLAKLETERATLAKDLAITTAVQSLFLPKESNNQWKDLKIAGFYRPAAQSGGDWWWYDRRLNGITSVFLGDVTGHGAGSAMMVAAVSSAYLTLKRAKPIDTSAAVLLAALNDSFVAQCGNYRMTLAAVEIDPIRQQIRWWSAGAPPLMILRKDKIEVITATGTPLGSTPFEAGAKSVPLQVGDRLLLFSDGLVETEAEKGGQFGIRRLRDLLSSSKNLSTELAKEKIIATVDTFRGSSVQDDDITFAVIDYVP